MALVLSPNAQSSTAKLEWLSLPEDSFFNLVLIGCFLVHWYFEACCNVFCFLLVIRGGMPVTCSIFCMGVDFIMPVMILRAWFCTLFRVFWCVLAAVIQEFDPYSRKGCTVPW